MSKRIKVIAVLLLVIAAIAVGLWLAVVQPFRSQNLETLQAALAEARDAGIPTTAAEAYAAKPMPKANGAEVYQQAFDAHVRPQHTDLSDDECQVLPLRGEYDFTPGADIPALHRASLDNYVSENQTAIALLRLAAEFKESQFPLRYEDGTEMWIPHVRRLRDSAALLSCSALANALKGNSVEAERDILALAAIDRALEHDFCTISQLVRIAIAGILDSAVEDYIRRYKPTQMFFSRPFPKASVLGTTF